MIINNIRNCICIKKPYVFLSILYFLVISSCKEEDIASMDRNDIISKELSFIPHTNNTKGLPIGVSNDLKDIAVFGYYTGNGSENWANKGADATPNYFNNLLVTNDGAYTSVNNWVTAQNYYWPNYIDANLTFFAYSPHIDTSETNYYGLEILETTGGLKMKYTVSQYCAFQPDLMMAVPRFDLNPYNNPGPVELNMKHALAAIGFTAEGSYDTINTINITNVSISGEVSLNLNDTTFTWVLDPPSDADNYAITENELQLTNTPQQVIKGNGYIMVPPQILTDSAKLIVQIKQGPIKTISLAGQEWKAGEKIIYNLNAKYNPANMDVTVIERGFVHAFWRYNETGERIIRMDNPYGGKWEAFVLCTDGQWSDNDIMLDYLPSDYSSAQGQEISAPIAQMTESYPMVSNDGNISFRIGLKENTTLSSADSKPRYAIIAIKYDKSQKNHLIYLRQGEASDIVNGSLKFSAFNLSDTKIENTDSYEFIYYPSMAGAYKQWNTSTMMYPLTGASSDQWNPSDVNYTSIANVCPQGYIIPSYNDFKELITAQEGTSGCLYGGLCADGFFDRETLTNISEYGFQAGSGSGLAFSGYIIYNAITYASIFIPFAGQLTSTGTVDAQSTNAYYWTSTLKEGSKAPYYLGGSFDNNEIKINAGIDSICIVNNANSIRAAYSGSN